MKTPLILLLGATSVIFAGCLNLTPPASPAQSRGLTLDAKSSANVQVNPPRLQMNHGMLELSGSITKRPGASSTAFSHLDILFCRSAGNVLETKLVQYIPKSVGHSRFSARNAYYSVNLGILPEGTARIEVHAHDGDIAATHN